MYELRRTTPEDPAFLELVGQLDLELRARNGAEQDALAPLNSLSAIRHALVAEEAGRSLGCGAFKFQDSSTVELKRMFVAPEARRRGLAAALVGELESWARAEGAREAVLETGVRHLEAIALYVGLGYQRIPNYGAYADNPGSVCYRKPLG